MAHEIYWERQMKPDMCRLYSINAFYGEHLVSEEQFKQFCELYKKEYPGTEPFSFTNIPSNNITIVHYILGITHKIKCEYVPIGHLQDILDKRKI